MAAEKEPQYSKTGIFYQVRRKARSEAFAEAADLVADICGGPNNPDLVDSVINAIEHLRELADHED